MGNKKRNSVFSTLNTMMHRIDVFALFVVVLSASFGIQQTASLEANNITHKQPSVQARSTTPAPKKTTRKEEESQPLSRDITEDDSAARSKFLSALKRLLTDLHRSRNKDKALKEDARKTRISANQTNAVKSQKSLEQSQEEGEEASQDRGLTLLDGFLDSCGGDSSDEFFTTAGPLNLTALCNHPIGQTLPICVLPEPPTFSPTTSSTKTKKKSKKLKSAKAKEPKTKKGKTKKKAKTTGIASSTTEAPVSVAPTINPTVAPSPPPTSRPTRQPITTPPPPMSGRGQPPDGAVPDPPPFDDPPQLPPQGDPPQLPP